MLLKVKKYFPDVKGIDNFLIKYILSIISLMNVYVFWKKLTNL